MEKSQYLHYYGKRKVDTASLVELVAREAANSSGRGYSALMDALKNTGGGYYQPFPEQTKPLLIDIIGKQLSLIDKKELEGADNVLVRFPDAVLRYVRTGGGVEFSECHSTPVTLRQGPYLIVAFTESSLDQSLDYQRLMARQQKHYKIRKCRVGDRNLPVVYACTKSVNFSAQTEPEIPCGLKPDCCSGKRISTKKVRRPVG